MKLNTADVLREVDRLTCLQTGKEHETKIIERLKIIARFLMHRSSMEQVRTIIDRCISQFQYVPTPAAVEELAGAVYDELRPAWQPPPRPKRTMQDILDDINFQEKWKVERPRLAYVADEKLAELREELERMVVAA